MRNTLVLKVLPVFLLCFLFFADAFSQSHIQRISNTARSDNMGYVVRYHLSAPVDSFEIIQPAPDLIQMVLYSEEIDTSGILLPEQSQVLKEVRLYELGYGYGADIYLTQDNYFKASAYIDQNGKDVLVGLTLAPREEVERHSHRFLARNWYEEIISEDALEVSAPKDTTPYNEAYNNVKDKLRFDKVVIDPGHGGYDPGNLGYKHRYEEKDVALSIAKKLGDYIEKLLPGVEVIYTRDGDYLVGSKENPNITIMESLVERGQIANREEADLFVSIHADAFYNSSVRGSSVYFLGLNRSKKSFEVMREENQIYHNGVMEDLTQEDLIIYELANSGKIAASERFAYMVEDQLKNRAQRKSRGVRQMGLVVLYQSTMPGILVETGYLTNPSEGRFLTSDYGQSIIASAIFRAIRDYKENYDQKQAYSATSN